MTAYHKGTTYICRSVKGRGDQARLFTSILVHLEEQNNLMMSKLQGTNEERSCAVMQQHLEKLKNLVDKVFVGGAALEVAQFALDEPVTSGGEEANDLTVMQSLNGPSLIESTPLHAAVMGGNFGPRRNQGPLLKQQKLMSRIQLNKNFSPVVLKQSGERMQKETLRR